MFLQQKNLDKPVEPFVQVPATAGESYTPGEVLTMTNGAATKCSGATVPVYICQKTLAEAADGDLLDCTVVNAQQELEVPLSADGTALKVGNKVTIGADGLTVTATTTSGVFFITEILGTAVGDMVRGYFMRLLGEVKL